MIVKVNINFLFTLIYTSFCCCRPCTASCPPSCIHRWALW